MRIRFITRTQAICLVLSLFLGIFILGLGLGWMFFGHANPLGSVEAFAPITNASLEDEEATPLPSYQQSISQTQEPKNLFSFSTASSIPSSPIQTPSILPSISPFAQNVTPSPDPSGFSIQVIKGAKQSEGIGQKRILIYHTHTYEAYEPTPENTYEPTQQWRTKDSKYNVVRIGEELTSMLTAAGFYVVHDTTAYEPPVLNSSYNRSLKMLEESISRGEKYDLYIDLHRDAFSDSLANHNTVQVGDQKIARLMMLVGKGTAGYEVRPDWEKNLVIAQAITDSLNQQITDLCRSVKLKTGRFNQHIAPNSILVEVGNNKNTLEEALASIPYLSDAIADALAVTHQQ